MPVSQQHSEIFHYTSIEGLSGIIDSQTLRASHAAFLNDSSELQVFFDKRFPGLIANEVRAGLRTLAAAPGNAELIIGIGGFEAAVAEVSNGIITGTKVATLQFNETYIMSFCSAADDWTRSNGLLSQWRGYGRGGGCAIALRAEELEAYLKEEESNFHYQRTQLENVHYYGGSELATTPAEEITEAERRLRGSVFAFLTQRAEEALDPVYEAATTLSCLYKHWAFNEEREVRMVAIPAHPEVISESRKSRTKAPPEKPRSHFLRDGSPVPCIHLLGRGQLLPISRVIVGPHPEQDLRRIAIESLLRKRGIDASVVTSKIPFRAR